MTTTKPFVASSVQFPPTRMTMIENSAFFVSHKNNKRKKHTSCRVNKARASTTVGRPEPTLKKAVITNNRKKQDQSKSLNCKLQGQRDISKWIDQWRGPTLPLPARIKEC